MGSKWWLGSKLVVPVSPSKRQRRNVDLTELRHLDVCSGTLWRGTTMVVPSVMGNFTEWSMGGDCDVDEMNAGLLCRALSSHPHRDNSRLLR